jgi:signal transduction histidine kinase
LVPTLFERSPRAPGSRLGLWLAASLARSSGGGTWYEPNEPRGACFCLRLPGPAGDAPFTAPRTAERGGGS